MKTVTVAAVVWGTLAVGSAPAYADYTRDSGVVTVPGKDGDPCYRIVAIRETYYDNGQRKSTEYGVYEQYEPGLLTCLI